MGNLDVERAENAKGVGTDQSRQCAATGVCVRMHERDV